MLTRSVGCLSGLGCCPLLLIIGDIAYILGYHKDFCSSKLNLSGLDRPVHAALQAMLKSYPLSARILRYDPSA